MHEQVVTERPRASEPEVLAPVTMPSDDDCSTDTFTAPGSEVPVGDWLVQATQKAQRAS